MNVSRRDVVVAGAFAFGASGLLLSGAASAQGGDEAAVAQNVEILRKAQLEADRASLAQVTSDQVSYGHSDGRVETKEQFIAGVMNRKQVVKSLTFPDLKLSVAGDAAIVLGNEAWHPGVIGIVASRLVERYGRPTFLIGWEPGGEFGRGSGRSIPGFDLHGALHRVGAHLEKYGGHTMAAGFTVRRDRFEAFRAAFLGVASELLTPDDLAPSQRVDLELPLAGVSEELERLIRHLEPCGAGNPAPVFGVRNARAVGARRVGTNHLRFTLDDGSGVLPAIGFRWADHVPEEWLGEPLDVAFRLERDDWQGRVTIQARIASLAPHHSG